MVETMTACMPSTELASTSELRIKIRERVVRKTMVGERTETRVTMSPSLKGMAPNIRLSFLVTVCDVNR